jgi:polyhydroxyalkanoate synthesis regulator phasin
MATNRPNRQSQVSILQLGELRARVDRIRRDVEEAVESLGKRAVHSLPPRGRRQVDEVLDRISTVRGDVNKTVDGWRSDLEKRYRVVRGTVDKRVSTIRRQTRSRSRRIVTLVEKRTRRYIDLVVRQLRLPMRSDIEAVKRRLGALERRVEDIEKNGKAGRKAAA